MFFHSHGYELSLPFDSIFPEPWHNLPDYEDTDGKIENKPGIIKLESKNTYTNEHKITYFKN